MFSPEELYLFLRHRVSLDLAESLPAAHREARRHYAASVAEKLFDHGLVKARFFAAWRDARPGRTEEIEALEARTLDAASGPTDLPPDHLVAYVEWLRQRYGRVDMIGLGAQDLRMSLDDIYVPLQLDLRSDMRSWPERTSSRRADEHAGPDEPSHGVPSPDPRATGSRRSAMAHGPRKIALEQAFTVAEPCPGLLVLGRPGAGKTTALRKLLWSLVRPVATSPTGSDPGGLLHGEALGLPSTTLPVFLRLRNFPGPLLGRSMAEFLQLELDRDARPDPRTGVGLDRAILDDLGETLWRRGDLLLLCDGLDEVADPAVRARVCRYLEDQLRDAAKRGIRAVVSSRYSGISVDSDLHRRLFLPLAVDSLDDDQIAQLVTRWFEAAECALDRSDNEQDARHRGAARARSLATRLSHSEYKVRHLRQLSTNPMLLTLLCVVVFRKDEIPERRVDFFRECLDILLGRWIRGRGHDPMSTEPSVIGSVLDEPLLRPSDALEILAPLAWHMHTTRRRDDVRRGELDRLLRPTLDSLERRRGQLHFTEVLRWLHQIAGVLTRYATHEDGTGEYGFMHLSLQEYLAAHHAATEGEIDLLAEHFGDSWWREVIALFVAYSQRRRDFVDLVTRVIERGALGDDERVALLTACIADARNPDLSPIIEFAADSTKDESERAAALGLLTGYVDHEVLHALARIACETGSADLCTRAERIEASASPTRRAPAFQAVERDPGPLGAHVCHVAESDAAQAIAAGVRQRGLDPWLDEEHPELGGSWSDAVARTSALRAAAVLLGPGGAVPWHDPDLRLRLSLMVRRGHSVVVVYLPGLGSVPRLPLFLDNAPVVDLRDGIGRSGLDRLVSGLRGEELAPLLIQELRPGQRHLDDRVGMAMLWIPHGRFTMGSQDDDHSAYDDEMPVREVTISGFLMGETAVTNAQYERYVRAGGEEPEFWSVTAYNQTEQPVVGVSWYDAVAYCNFLSQQAGLSPCYVLDGEEVSWQVGAEGYRLPTEAEWEYACRAGTRTRWSFDDDENKLAWHGWYDANSSNELQPVARKKPNPWGLYDMHGNVSEWCWDWFQASYAGRASVNPTGPERSELTANDLFEGRAQRLLRGGAFMFRARDLRSADRFWARPVIRVEFAGFRCVRGVARQP